ncbi:MAG TPA: hypothetical protein GX010_01580 [Erysipelotrichaceae bacterium]|nr:hypothetical protein [Erysipelotrichaceae bacterium]
MEFKRKSIYLLMIGLLAMTSCNTKNGETKKEDFSYDNLYQTIYEKPFEEKERKTTKARYGYILNDKQGHNSWYYLYQDKNGQNFEMNYKNDRFNGRESYLDQDKMHSTSKEKAIRQYLSSFDEEVVIYGNFKMLENSRSGATLKIMVNNTSIYEKSLPRDDLIGKYFEISHSLHIADRVCFIVEGEDCLVSLDPSITSEDNQNVSLYHLNDFGKQYGDVYPWYSEEEHTLYNWYLWSDDCMASAQPYSWCIDVSTNLIKTKTYEEANNYDLFYKHAQNYHMTRIYDVGRFIDNTIYTYGLRDNMLYFDKELNRYVLIGGCYRAFSAYWDSDLMIYVSDDELGLSWSRPGNPVFKNYVAHLPECPSLLKIGKRWYSFVSVSHITKHQIGPLQYWVGDEDVDCMDVDWLSKDFKFLDGEDLCAARPTYVGDKVYMWGWITASHNAVPLAPWAGYLNLPREVVARDDGSLGGRMDPGLARYINFGNIAKTEQVDVSDDMVLLRTDNQRNFVTFDVDLSNATEASYSIVQNRKLYKCSLVKENQKTYMRISSPDDSSHPVNSQIEIYQPSIDDKYKIKIVIDGRFIEFFANEDNALTGSTNMDNSASYDAYVSATGTASFSNIMINRLRSYGDCD